MVNVAVLGFGVVGSGVAEVLSLNGACIDRKAGGPIRLKYILDVRDFPDSPFGDRVVHDFSVIESDPEVSVVVETIGGAKAALDFTRRALRAGKSVVTSNKELVAEHGQELLELAREKGVSYLFEASVGGGIPIIRPLNQCLAANRVEEMAARYPKPLKVAVMGCVVNGPGEAREADLGIAGGKGEGLLIRRGKILRKVPEDQLLPALEWEIAHWEETDE